MGATSRIFFLKYFFHATCNTTDPISAMKNMKRNVNGMIIPILIFSINSSDDKSHQIAKAQLSPINILAGLILYHKNAASTAIRIAMTVVVIYVP